MFHTPTHAVRAILLLAAVCTCTWLQPVAAGCIDNPGGSGIVCELQKAFGNCANYEVECAKTCAYCTPDTTTSTTVEECVKKQQVQNPRQHLLPLLPSFEFSDATARPCPLLGQRCQVSMHATVNCNPTPCIRFTSHAFHALVSMYRVLPWRRRRYVGPRWPSKYSRASTRCNCTRNQ